MDYETVSPGDFGQSLTGMGVNLLTPDVRGLAALLVEAFGATAHRLSDDFAIVRYQGTTMQLHDDATYGSHPLHGMLPENPPRGSGIQLYFFGADPDYAAEQATRLGATVLEVAANKPHGLYEGTILSAEGYALSAAIFEKL